MTQPDTLREALEDCTELLRRYREETPPGHSPHMICHKADEALERADAALLTPTTAPEPGERFGPKQVSPCDYLKIRLVGPRSIERVWVQVRETGPHGFAGKISSHPVCNNRQHGDEISAAWKDVLDYAPALTPQPEAAPPEDDALAKVRKDYEHLDALLGGKPPSEMFDCMAFSAGYEAAITAERARYDRLVEAAFSEGHRFGRGGGVRADVPGDWAASEVRKALSNPTQEGEV